MIFSQDDWEEYEAPELAMHLLKDTAGSQFLLLTGPEPDHEWELFTQAVRDVSSRLGVRLAAGFHGIPMGAPHTRPLGVTAHATSSGLTTGYPPLVDRLQVPGSVAALLEMRLGEEDRAAVGFAGHVPHYLAQAAYPTAAITLLDSVSRATRLQLPDEALRDAARETDEEVRRHVEDESADRVLVRDERAGLDPGDGLAHVLVEVGEGLRRPTGLDAGVLLDAGLEVFVGECEHPAVGVVDENDLLGTEQPLTDGERADLIVGDHAAGVADHVRLAVVQAEDRVHVQPGVHAGH